jgi:tetratricopeptide (TPR) repeat protein
MSTKTELFNEAQGQIQTSPEKALQTFKQCALEFKAELNNFDALSIMTFMRSSTKIDLNLAHDLAMNHDDIKVRNIYSWLIFDNCIKKRDLKQIQGFEQHIEQMSDLVQQKNLKEDDSYPCPLSIAIFKMADSFSDVSFNALKVKHWLTKLNVDFLSHKTSKINTPKGEIELSSDYEKYHGLLSKALYKLGEYNTCLELSKKALSTIDNFHFNNDLWFKMRVALCEENLGNHEESERILMELLDSKEGGDKWFLYRDISEVYFEQKEYEKAWKYAVDSAFYGNEPHFLINLYLLQARILFKLQRTEKIELLAYLVASIVKEQGWTIKSEHEKLISFYKINMNELQPTQFYYKQALRFWESERYKGIELLNGTIISVLPNGKGGKIADENGNKYKFSKKFILMKVRDLNELKGSKVTFFPMKSFGNSNSAEHIKVLDQPKSNPSQNLANDLVGKEIKGNVGSIVEFGLFVKMKGLQDGLLHINNMPQDLKSAFKERYQKGDEITVQIKRITEKGIELKFIK